MRLQTSRRDTDPGKWYDPWFKRLKSTEKLLMLYLWDMADIAGFVDDFNEEDASDETGLSVEEVLGASEGLVRAYRGASKVLTRGKLGSSEGLNMWCTTYVKFQQRGRKLNRANNCHRGILERLEEKESMFPEVKKLLKDSYEGPTKRGSREVEGLVSPKLGSSQPLVSPSLAPREGLCKVRYGKVMFNLMTREGLIAITEDEWGLLVENWVVRGKLSKDGFEEACQSAIATAVKIVGEGEKVKAPWQFLQRFMKHQVDKVARERDSGGKALRGDEIDADVYAKAG